MIWWKDYFLFLTKEKRSPFQIKTKQCTCNSFEKCARGKTAVMSTDPEVRKGCSLVVHVWNSSVTHPAFAKGPVTRYGKLAVSMRQPWSEWLNRISCRLFLPLILHFLGRFDSRATSAVYMNHEGAKKRIRRKEFGCLSRVIRFPVCSFSSSFSWSIKLSFKKNLLELLFELYFEGWFSNLNFLCARW